MQNTMLIRLEATFPDQATARMAADDLVTKGFTRTSVRELSRDDEETGAEHREIEEQTEAMVAGPGVVATKGMAMGAVIGAGLLGVLGAVLGLLIASVTGQVGTGRAILVVACGVAGLTGGFVAGGFMTPRRLEEPHEPQPGWTTISVVTDRQKVPAALDVLRSRDPERVDLVDSSGRQVMPEEVDLRDSQVNIGR